MTSKGRSGPAVTNWLSAGGTAARAGGIGRPCAQTSVFVYTCNPYMYVCPAI